MYTRVKQTCIRKYVFSNLFSYPIHVDLNIGNEVEKKTDIF